MMRVKSISQSLKVYFSNQPKNIQKPSPIEFDFKIPNKTKSHNHQSKNLNASSQQVNFIKANRNVDVSKILKKKKQSSQLKSKIQQTYQQQQQQKIIENLKTQRYHQQEYFKGQHLLQNIPLDAFHTYKLADFQRKMQLQKEKVKDFMSSSTDYNLLAETKFKIAEMYHQKQQKYQVEEFIRYLGQYPGSPKGPNPDDDMDFFIEYAFKKMPQILLIDLAAKQALRQNANQKGSANNIHDLQAFTIKQEVNYSSILDKVRTLQQPLQKDYRRDNLFNGAVQSGIFKEHEQIPTIPELEFRNYQHYMRDLTSWFNFKNYYVRKNGQNDVIRQVEEMTKVYIENDPQPDNQYYTPRANAPSLLRYYKTLPKHLQDHPGLKDIYLGLQFHLPHFAYEEKQQLLNHACTMILPLDKVSERAMSDFVNTKKKYYLTPFMVDKIFTINPEFTWDIKDFFAQIKREQLKGQSMIKQNQGSYPEPPQVHLQWEEGAANLPVDFYENDDGFWDEIISQKLKRQDQAKPIMKVRKHFYH